VRDLLALAKESDHFDKFYITLLSNGDSIGERKDEYVNELYLYMKKKCNGMGIQFGRRCFRKMIEARSCERFKGTVRECSRRGGSFL
jgi:tRNA-(ms[2]io[6]A)-hydroxylase